MVHATNPQEIQNTIPLHHRSLAEFPCPKATQRKVVTDCGNRHPLVPIIPEDLPQKALGLPTQPPGIAASPTWMHTVCYVPTAAFPMPARADGGTAAPAAERHVPTTSTEVVGTCCGSVRRVSAFCGSVSGSVRDAVRGRP